MSMDRSSRQKINKETLALNDTLDKIELINIYRTFHPKPAEPIFFSSANEIFSRMDQILGHKKSINKFKKFEIISSITSNHKSKRLETTTRKKLQKNKNMWRLNNMLLNNKWVIEEIKEEMKNTWKQMKTKTQQSNMYGIWQKQF